MTLPMFSFVADYTDTTRFERVSAMAESVGKIVQLAEVLARTGRDVDLRGLEDKVGQLCACALDLPDEQRRALVPVLENQLEALSHLDICIRTKPGLDLANRSASGARRKGRKMSS